MIRFITYLRGSSNWNAFAPVLPSTYTPLPGWIKMLMGIDDVSMCVALYRLLDSQSAYSHFIKKPDTMMEGMIPVVTPGTLTSTGKGAVKIIPSETRFVGDVMCTAAPELRYVSATKATLSVGEYSESVAVSSPNSSSLIVEWPAWLCNNGTVVLSSTWKAGSVVPVPVRWKFPVKEVDKRLRSISEAYDFMEENGMSDMFYSADTPTERVCVMLVAMLRAVGYITTK